MAFLFGLACTVATWLGGMFALRRSDRLHLILGFSAGAVIGVAFFDLLPEALDLAGGRMGHSAVTSIVAVGFLVFMLLSRVALIRPHGEACDDERHQGRLGATSLSLHSLMDGIGIGLAFQVSPSVGLIVAVAVAAHDFSDGINTVSFVLTHQGGTRASLKWLAVDAFAPLAGVLIAHFVHMPQAGLGMVLALFCGFFLYIGASDLVPESHHRHPKLITSLMTVAGAAVIYLAVHFAPI